MRALRRCCATLRSVRALLTRPPHAAAAWEPPNVARASKEARAAAVSGSSMARWAQRGERCQQGRRERHRRKSPPTWPGRARRRSLPAKAAAQAARRTPPTRQPQAAAARGTLPWPGRAGRRSSPPIAAARPRVERDERRPCGSRRRQRHRSPPPWQGRARGHESPPAAAARPEGAAQRAPPGRQPQAAAMSPASWGEQAGLRRRRRRQGD